MMNFEERIPVRRVRQVANFGQFAEAYTSALAAHLASGGENTLSSAGELGRKALEDGLGPQEMATAHHQALSGILGARPASPEKVAQISSAALSFFLECLNPFEAALRGNGETDKALRDGEERYRELFENANDIVFTADLEGNFTSFNRAYERLTGYRRDQTPPMNIAQLVAPEYLDQVLRMRDSKLSGQTTTTYEVEMLTRDGRRVPLELSTRLIFREGRPVGVQGIGREITERRRAQEALRQFNAALEAQAKRIAHALHDEAGQLLASVHIELDDLARAVPAENRPQFKKISDTLYEIEDQLRQFSHELRPTVLDDLGLKAGLEFLAKNVARRTGLSISVENSFEQRLPAPMETALYRITQEALTNITKHAQAKNVVLLLRGEKEKVYYSIRDDGVGFDAAEALSRRGHCGLGLLGIQMRLNAFGGSFSVTSQPAKGSELLMTIPLGR